jgi:hypothetical protein
LSVALSGVGCEGADHKPSAQQTESIAATESRLYAFPTPAVTTAYPAVGRVRVFGNSTCYDGTPDCRECTAVLVHRDYILTTASCGISPNGNPVATAGLGDTVTFGSSGPRRLSAATDANCSWHGACNAGIRES